MKHRDLRASSNNTIFVTRSGRKLEVKEYGDPAGHPVFFFHGMIGSHHQASYISDQAGREGFRIIAPNRPGVGLSEFVKRKSPSRPSMTWKMSRRLSELDEFSVIGISGGTAYALATLFRLGRRIRTVTVISGMGPMRLPGAIRSMDRRRRMVLEIGSRYPHLALRVFPESSVSFPSSPRSVPEPPCGNVVDPGPASFPSSRGLQLIHERPRSGLHEGKGPETLSQELAIYRHYGFSVKTCRLRSESPSGTVLLTTSSRRRWPGQWSKLFRTASCISCRGAISSRLTLPAKSFTGCNCCSTNRPISRHKSPVIDGGPLGADEAGYTSSVARPAGRETLAQCLKLSCGQRGMPRIGCTSRRAAAQDWALAAVYLLPRLECGAMPLGLDRRVVARFPARRSTGCEIKLARHCLVRV